MEIAVEREADKIGAEERIGSNVQIAVIHNPDDEYSVGNEYGKYSDELDQILYGAATKIQSAWRG